MAEANAGHGTALRTQRAECVTVGQLTAHRTGHPFAGPTHLLAATLTDEAGPAARLLRSLDADPTAVRTLAAGQLLTSAARASASYRPHAGHVLPRRHGALSPMSLCPSSAAARSTTHPLMPPSVRVACLSCATVRN
jgi:hypothetical protein